MTYDAIFPSPGGRTRRSDPEATSGPRLLRCRQMEIGGLGDVWQTGESLFRGRTLLLMWILYFGDVGCVEVGAVHTRFHDSDILLQYRIVLVS